MRTDVPATGTNMTFIDWFGLYFAVVLWIDLYIYIYEVMPGLCYCHDKNQTPSTGFSLHLSQIYFPVFVLILADFRYV